MAAFLRPTINIQYSHILSEVFLEHVKSKSQHKEKWQAWEPWNRNKIEAKIKEYKKEWSKYEDIFLEKMCEATQLTFTKNVIPVYVVLATIRNSSNPIIVRISESNEKFVVVLAHELLHELCPWSEDGGTTYTNEFKKLKEMFPGESNIVVSHCLIYSVLKYIFEDMPNGSSLWEIARDQALTNEEYKKSIFLMEKRTHQKILDEFKKIHPQ